MTFITEISKIFKKKDKQPKLYYRVFDKHSGTFFATGYNSTSEKQLIKCFNQYINGARNTNIKFTTWKEIEDYLQGIEVETSVLPFKEL